MDWTIVLDASGRFLRITTRGVFNSADHVAFVEAVLVHPDWHPGRDALFDHRALDFGGTTLQTMLQATETHLRNDARIGDGKAAMVMGGPAAFASGRQFESLLGAQISASLHVFLELDAAERWLLG